MSKISLFWQWLIQQLQRWQWRRLASNRWQRNCLWFLLSLVLYFALNFPLPVQAQSWLTQPSPQFSSLTHDFWWNPSGPRRCGRLLCADVLLYGDRIGLTIAAPLTQNADEKGFSLEERSRQIQASFTQLIEEIPKYPSDLPPPALWSLQPPQTFHPQLPALDIGLENDQTVLYVPQQKGLSPRTLVTITNFDVKQNRQTSAQALAEQWRRQMHSTISAVLWGQHYDAVHPLGRPLALGGITTVAGLAILFINWLKRWTKGIERELRRRQKQLRESVQLLDPEVASVEDLDAAAQAAELQSTTPSTAELAESVITPPANPTTPLGSTTFSHNNLGQGANLEVVAQTQALLNRRLQFWLEHLPRPSLNRQSLLKQQRNLLQLGLRLLFWLQFSLLWLAVTLISLIYPALRPYAASFWSQAFILPLIWMGIHLLDKVSDVLIERWLNQWAKHQQEMNPRSQRYALRAETYATALRGFTTVIFSLLGLYWTVRTFGLNPAVLASAGFFGAALVLVARRILQDMLNGALILATDRYAVGDVITVSETTGLVESMNLHSTQLRGRGGRLVTIPNGQILTVENLTKDWSRVEFELAIAYDADLNSALTLVRETTAALASDPTWQNKILEPPAILGLDQANHAGLVIKIWIKTQPLQQWAVERELRLRLKLALDQAQIAIAIPQQRWWKPTD